MRKFVSLILLCSLLIVCFSGCSPSNNKNEKNSGDENEGNVLELNEVFDTIRDDAKKNTKLGFSVEYEQIYFELKESGEYDNTDWLDSIFIVTVNCSYDEATNEDWYEQCVNKDIKSLNEAFFNQYSRFLSHGIYSNIVFSPGLHLIYDSPEDFDKDYATIKTLANLDYVTQVYIVYKFGLPRDYFME